MKRKALLCLLNLALTFGAMRLATAQAVFSFQGKLTDDCCPATGVYDMRFQVHTEATLNTPIGPPTSTNGVPVTNGLFAVFIATGPGAWDGSVRWLEIRVATNGSPALTTLVPRQQVTPTPMALFASQAGSVSGLRIVNSSVSPNVIGGHSANIVGSGAAGATISGGGSALKPNQISADFGVIGGGLSNLVTGELALVGGGFQNTAYGSESVVNGGQLNLAGAHSSTVGGGTRNMISATNDARHSTIGGGEDNAIDVAYATIAGGELNHASGHHSFIGGGYGNATPGGGATVPGGQDNTAFGQFSFAAGRNAKADHDNGFVWADGSDFHSTAPHQFLIHASGGVGIGKNNPSTALDVNGVINATDIYKNGVPFSPSLWSSSGSSIYYNEGNVGIGTANPQARLEIKAPIEGEVLRLGYSTLDHHSVSVGYHGERPDFNYLGFDVEHGSSDARRVLTLRGDGKVGIGTSTPQAALDVVGVINGSQGFTVPNGLAGNGQVISRPGFVRTSLLSSSWSSSTGDYVDLEVPGNDGAGNRVRITSHGNVGIATASPAGKLHVFGNSAPGANIPANTTVLASGDGFNNRFMSANGDQATYLSAFNTEYGELSTYDYATGQGMKLVLNANGGTVSVPVLEIRGGSDLAEPFQMSEERIAEGSVVIIDEEHPGKLKLAMSAYDTRVAGIVSGANGIKAGIALHQEGMFEGGQNVALVGRVYALADATEAPIKPGDLLATSNTPGHCMKVTDQTKAQGTIIGKAMSALDKGKGIVLVLVSLQ